MLLTELFIIMIILHITILDIDLLMWVCLPILGPIIVTMSMAHLLIRWISLCSIIVYFGDMGHVTADLCNL